MQKDKLAAAVPDPGRLNDLIRAPMMATSRRAVHRLLAAIRSGALVLLGLLSVSGPAAAQCDQDFPTEASLQAARAAIAGGAPDVALSPGGCLRYRRWFGLPLPGPAKPMREEISFDGKLVALWFHTTVSWTPPDPPPIYLYSSGIRDSELDGFFEWSATIWRDITPPRPFGPPRDPTRIVISEFDPVSQRIAQRRTYVERGDTMHVTVERGEGSLRVVAQYEVPALVEQPTPGAADRLNRPTSVPCSDHIVDEVNTMIVRAAANGSRCLQKSGMYRKAFGVAMAVTEHFQVDCERGRTGRKAGIDWMTASDPLRRIYLLINLDRWAEADSTGRESIIFHELLHLGMEDHDKALEDIMETDDKRWRELDPIAACNSLCYNPGATKCECARCLGKETCDGPCAGLSDCYTNQIGAFCNCPLGTRRWYSSLGQCEAACSSGLGCFGAFRCEREVNACKMP